jgi:hypothetical protein
MSTQAILAVHGQRTRTRSAAFLLAVTAFAAAKLISLGAVNVSHAHEIEGLQMLDVDCGAEHAVSC